jgi:hypothetical protein
MKSWVIKTVGLVTCSFLIGSCSDRRKEQNESSAKLLAMAADAYASDATGQTPALQSELTESGILLEKPLYVTSDGQRLEFQYFAPLHISDSIDSLSVVAPVSEKNGTRLVVTLNCEVKYLTQDDLTKALLKTAKFVEKNRKVIE